MIRYWRYRSPDVAVNNIVGGGYAKLKLRNKRKSVCQGACLTKGVTLAFNQCRANVQLFRANCVVAR
jgi:hypothetical protein